MQVAVERQLEAHHLALVALAATGGLVCAVEILEVAQKLVGVLRQCAFVLSLAPLPPPGVRKDTVPKGALRPKTASWAA